ncbi:MAG: dihydropteroate synthase [Proteobacteria bacterium]|nr:MAG: dihydropteroate synthase [Pseudomonadota bacterium]PIE64438.1 MAG: dihydropteroate synthase [Desulfobacterales bacterium]
MTDYQIMGIINVTPDSFSDGGRFHEVSAAVSQAKKLIQDGTDIIDVGGESTRPYAEPVGLEEELSRVIPVITAIRSFSDIPISIDTIKADVARQAISAGATIINDISAFENDESMIDVAIENKTVKLVIMHMQGNPGTMQDNPIYHDVVEEVYSYLQARIDSLQKAGIARSRIIVDPGIGFGKKLEHNLSLIKHLDRFQSLGCQLLLGHSRKRFLGEITNLAVTERDTVTAIVSALGLQKGVSIFRVHNVAASRHTLDVAHAVMHAN